MSGRRDREHRRDRDEGSRRSSHRDDVSEMAETYSEFESRMRATHGRHTERSDRREQASRHERLDSGHGHYRGQPSRYERPESRQGHHREQPSRRESRHGSRPPTSRRDPPRRESRTREAEYRASRNESRSRHSREPPRRSSPPPRRSPPRRSSPSHRDRRPSHSERRPSHSERRPSVSHRDPPRRSRQQTGEPSRPRAEIHSPSSSSDDSSQRIREWVTSVSEVAQFCAKAGINLDREQAERVHRQVGLNRNGGTLLDASNSLANWCRQRLTGRRGRRPSEASREENPESDLYSVSDREDLPPRPRRGSSRRQSPRRQSPPRRVPCATSPAPAPASVVNVPQRPVGPDDSISMAGGGTNPGRVYRNFDREMPPLFYGVPTHSGKSSSRNSRESGEDPSSSHRPQGVSTLPPRNDQPSSSRYPPNAYRGPQAHPGYPILETKRYGNVVETRYGPPPETRYGPPPETRYVSDPYTNPPVNPLYPPPQDEQPPSVAPKPKVDMKGKGKATDVSPPPPEPKVVDADDDDWRYSPWRWAVDEEGAKKDIEAKVKREWEAERAAKALKVKEPKAGESSSMALARRDGDEARALVKHGESSSKSKDKDKHAKSKSKHEKSRNDKSKESKSRESDKKDRKKDKKSDFNLNPFGGRKKK